MRTPDSSSNLRKYLELSVMLFILSSFMIGVLLNGRMTGMLILGEKTVSMNLSEQYIGSSTIEIHAEGNITSLKITGMFIGNGTGRILLGEKVIADSGKLGSGSSGNLITGYQVFEEEETQVPEENNTTEEISEIAEGGNLTVEEIAEEINVNETIITINETIIFNETEILNETIPINETTFENDTSVNISANISETENITSENITQNITIEEEPPEETIKEFQNYCDETCSIYVPKDAVIKIELDNIGLNLTRITYTYEEFSEDILNETNMTEVIENITINLTEINITNITLFENISEIFEENYSAVVIDEPVLWTRVINTSLSNSTLLPKDAFNISSENTLKIKTKDRVYTKDEFNEMAEYNRLSRKIKELEKPVKKEKAIEVFNKISELNKEISKIKEKEIINETELPVVIEDIDGEISEINYYREGPVSEEVEINRFSKRVTISSEIHYENISAYTELDDIPKSAIRLFWIVNDTKLEVTDIRYIDSNGNGLIDRIEWTVPHLSSQTYEISIVVLNPITYLRDGETWIVAFNTTGTANLTISSPNAGWTEFMKDNNETFDEMRFIDLRCGEVSLKESLKLIGSDNNIYDYASINEEDSVDAQKLVVENYECNETAYLSNQMLTAGYATIIFEFANQNSTVTDYAYDPVYPAQGIVMYGERDNATKAYYRIWNSTDFGSEMETPELAGGSQVQWVVSRSSTTRDEIAVGLVDNDGDILFNIYNVTADSWEEWIDVADIGLTNDIYRAFGIQSEATTGDFLIVYEKNTTADRSLGYRIWDGISWSEEGILTFSTGSAAEQQTNVRLDRNPYTEEIMMACFGASDDLSVSRWDGDSWENATTISTNIANVNEELLSIEYESISGDAMLAWGNATIANYNIFDNTTKSWSSILPIRDRAAVVQQITLCADPNSDYIGAIIGPDSGADLLAVMWDGNAWLAGEPTEETAVQNSVMANAYCSWSNSSDSAFFSFVDNTGLNIRYFTYNKTENAWKCTENSQTVTSLNNAEGSNGPCTSTASMNDDINVLRSLPDEDSRKIMLWGIDIDLNFETFLFNGTHIEQPETNLLEQTAGWLTTTEPGFFSYLRYPGAPDSAGVAFYGEFNESQYLRYRFFNGTDFEEEKTAPDLGPGTSMNYVMLKSSPIHNETAVGILDDDGDLNVNIYYAKNNTFSGWEIFSHIGVTNSVYRGFDIQQEGISGDIMIVYERNFQNGTTDLLLYYRIWNGSSWSLENNITLISPAAAESQTHIGLNNMPGTDEIMLTTIGASDDLSVARWDGESWNNITSITTAAADVNEDRFNIAYESISGDAMLAWGNATIANYNIFDNTTKSWSSILPIRDRAAVVQQVTLCSDPNSDYIGAIIGPDSTGDVLAVIWNGTNWISGEPSEEDVAENVAITNTFCRWTNTSTALFTYIDDGGLAIRYFIYDKADNTWKCSENGQTVTSLALAEGSNGPCTTGNIMSDDIELLRYSRDPTRDQMMMWGNDLAEDFEMFIFNGTHIIQPTTALLETVTPTASAIEPGYFDYFRFDAGYLSSPINSPPELSSVELKPDSPGTSNEIYCNTTVIDAENTTLQVEWAWYNLTGSGYEYILGGNISINNNTNSLVSTLGEGNTSAGETWNCTIRAFDGEVYSGYNSRLTTIEGSLPAITFVLDHQNANPVESSKRTVWIYFNVSHADGLDRLNDSSAKIQFNKTGEILRNSSVCIAQINDTATNTRMYNCSISMQYYDMSGTWTINASIKDLSENYVENTAEAFTYGQLEAMRINKDGITFGPVILGQTTGASNDPLTINNTGNMNFTEINITAYDLRGLTLDYQAISASSIYANISQDNLGDQMSDSIPVKLTNGTSWRDIGGEDILRSIYFWINVPSSGLSSQVYNASSPWIIEAFT